MAEKLEGKDKARRLRDIAEAMAEAGDKAGALAVAEKLKGEDKANALIQIALAIATEEVRDAKGEVIKDEYGDVKLKMRQSFAPEDKPIVERLVVLLK